MARGTKLSVDPTFSAKAGPLRRARASMTPFPRDLDGDIPDPALATDDRRAFSGEDHYDDCRYLDVVGIKWDGASKDGGRGLRSRPQ
jgi:hypothetical protein